MGYLLPVQNPLWKEKCKEDEIEDSRETHNIPLREIVGKSEQREEEGSQDSDNENDQEEVCQFHRVKSREALLISLLRASKSLNNQLNQQSLEVS